MKPLFPWAIFRCHETSKVEIVKRGVKLKGGAGIHHTVQPPFRPDFNTWTYLIRSRK